MDKEKQMTVMSVGAFIAIGVGVGTAVGVAVDNIGLGSALGVAIGAAIGGGIAAAQQAKVTDESDDGQQKNDG